MKKKVIESARRFIKKLFEEILDRESFVFEAPEVLHSQLFARHADR